MGQEVALIGSIASKGMRPYPKVRMTAMFNQVSL